MKGKERQKTKEPNSSFVEKGKEPVIERIFKLVTRYPSRSEAARAWEININTMQNYYKRRHQKPAPLPREHQLKKIAECENVSMEWLLTGQGEEPTIPERIDHSLVQKKRRKQPSNHRSNGTQAILGAWEALSEKEQDLLKKLILRKGGEFLTILLDDHIQELHALDGVRRLLALELKNIPEEKVREIYEEYEAKGNHFNVNEKQARA
ncbi:hypothetical protein G8935_003089 [Salmonella enterica]|nr:hypothetical protein [Salmonella enterica subsp. enterica serovar Poona]ECC9215368.1 hypothetical protein [Salmonella enterica subsp. enterica]ECD2404477.1 hypothetical protein [Salmonella enterica subsp. enterica serovar Richmond]EEH6201772.1 hypothetical protein [Salmonella enterica]ECG3311791.1 hypothetical protein [Salmonella enterica subsp. enterica serovar Richmond]